MTAPLTLAANLLTWADSADRREYRSGNLFDTAPDFRRAKDVVVDAERDADPATAARVAAELLDESRPQDPATWAQSVAFLQRCGDVVFAEHPEALRIFMQSVGRMTPESRRGEPLRQGAEAIALRHTDRNALAVQVQAWLDFVGIMTRDYGAPKQEPHRVEIRDELTAVVNALQAQPAASGLRLLKVTVDLALVAEREPRDGQLWRAGIALAEHTSAQLSRMPGVRPGPPKGHPYRYSSSAGRALEHAAYRLSVVTMEAAVPPKPLQHTAPRRTTVTPSAGQTSTP